jgi:ribosomal protein S18 acetylase RimI-like enzyme
MDLELLSQKAWEPEERVREIFLSVSPKNSTALKFYSKHGWKDLGPRPHAEAQIRRTV